MRDKNKLGAVPTGWRRRLPMKIWVIRKGQMKSEKLPE